MRIFGSRFINLHCTTFFFFCLFVLPIRFMFLAMQTLEFTRIGGGKDTSKGPQLVQFRFRLIYPSDLRPGTVWLFFLLRIRWRSLSTAHPLLPASFRLRHLSHPHRLRSSILRQRQDWWQNCSFRRQKQSWQIHPSPCQTAGVRRLNSVHNFRAVFNIECWSVEVIGNEFSSAFLTPKVSSNFVWMYYSLQKNVRTINALTL